MAVTIETQIAEYFTWGSYPYGTWGGDDIISWGTSGRTGFVLTDKERIDIYDGNAVTTRFNDTEETFNSTNNVFFMTAIEKDMSKRRFESVAINDIFSRNVKTIRKFAEPLDVCETYWDVIQFHLAFSESFNVTDSLYKSIGKLNKEKITLKDLRKLASTILKKDNISLADNMGREATFNRDYSEQINVAELLSKRPSLPFNESFGIGDTSNRSIGKIPIESLTVADTYNRKTKTVRDFSVAINIVEVFGKNVNTKHYEDVLIKDRYLKNVAGTYSNIFISEGEFSDDDFAEAINVAPGYTKFIDFKVGEYDYQEALVRVMLTSGSQAQPTAQGIVMHVDIPDTDDRGVATISDTSAPTQIAFNKPYYVIPEVQVTLRGANSSSGFVAPNITEITTNYFEVELLTAGGTRTTGTISWVSKGY